MSKLSQREVHAFVKHYRECNGTIEDKKYFDPKTPGVLREKWHPILWACDQYASIYEAERPANHRCVTALDYWPEGIVNASLQTQMDTVVGHFDAIGDLLSDMYVGKHPWPSPVQGRRFLALRCKFVEVENGLKRLRNELGADHG